MLGCATSGGGSDADGGQAIDARMDAPGPLGYAACEALADEWWQVVRALPNACDSDDDCIPIGGSDLGCDCDPRLTCDTVWQRQSFEASMEVHTIEAEYYARCDLGLCDCSPPHPACIDDVCTAVKAPWCLVSPDAAVDAIPDAGAALDAAQAEAPR